MSSNRPSQIPSIRKSSNHYPSSLMDRFSNININNNNNSLKGGKNQIASTIKQPSRVMNSFGFNSVGKQSLGFGSSTTGKTSLSKPSFGYASNIPSTVKSASRALISNNVGFNSIQKNAAKLFGFTPQTNRSTFMQNAAASSSKRLSRGSTRLSMKDNRLLSDAAYQRECQEKIVHFLTMNGYSNSISRQNLVRLSLSDASRIFQFLFYLLTNEEVVIKNGPNTSLDIVVPKIMELLGYPYPIKKSDLISFSGGRQLGSVLSMMDFLIEKINHLMNAEVERIISRNSNIWPDDENESDDPTRVLPKVHDLACEIDWENWELEREERLKMLGEELYCKEEEVEPLHKEVENLEQTLMKLDEELIYLTDLPQKRQELINDIENCSKYIVEMIEHNKANLAIKKALLDEIKLNKETLDKLTEENKKLEAIVNAQKPLQTEYQYAIERHRQILEEIEQAEKQNDSTQEEISKLNLEINKEKFELECMINDYNDMISILSNAYKSSKIHKFLPSFENLFHDDKEWLRFLELFENIRATNIDMIEEDKFKMFQELSMKKYNEFKLILVDQGTKLKHNVALQVACKSREREKLCDRIKQEVQDLNGQYQNYWEEKNRIETEHQIELKNLDQQIEQCKQKIQDHERLLNEKQMLVQKYEEKIKDKQVEIKNKQKEIMKNFQEKLRKDKDYEDKLMAKVDDYYKITIKENRKLEKILEICQKI